MKKVISVLMAVIMTVSCFALAFNVSAADYSKPTDKWILEQRKKYKDILVDNANNVDENGNLFITTWTDMEIDDPYYEAFLRFEGYGNTPAVQTIIKYNKAKNALEFIYNTFSATSYSNYDSYGFVTHTMLLSLKSVKPVEIDRVIKSCSRHLINGAMEPNYITENDKVSFQSQEYTRNCEKNINGKKTNDMFWNNKISEMFTAFERLLRYDSFHMYNLGFCKLCPGHSTTAKKTAATCTKGGYTTNTCRYCGQYYTSNEVAAKGHSYNTGKVTKKPTTSEKGVMTYTCTTCGAKKTSSISKLSKAAISKLTAKQKGFSASWKKLSSATGYQLQYSASKKFSNAKTLTITSKKTVSKSVSSLKAKTKYYVRIRTYRTINDKKYYSDWSAAKTVTTK